ALVVAAYDTELFGHWWHEGPAWLGMVLRALPAAGVRVTTLRGALEAGCLAGPVELPPSSWGSGKDWRVWGGEQVADLVSANAELQTRLLTAAGPHMPTAAEPRMLTAARPAEDFGGRDPARDQLVAEALLALSSDWAFMV